MYRGISKSITLLNALIVLLVNLAGAQQVVTVNPYTGSVNASIPLWQVSAGPLSLPITLNYGGNGIRTDQYMGAAGIGWHLSASGQISRQMRDLPDDLNDNNSGFGYGSRYGWLYGGAAQTSTFITNHATTADCTGDAYFELNLYGGQQEADDLIDMEPDLFRVSVPGHLSITFTFDASGMPVLQDVQEATITPTYHADGSIESFSVTANGGIQYEFSLQTSTTITLKGIAQEAVDYTDADVDYFKREYFTYKQGLSYNNVWVLDKITALTGEEIEFHYQTAETLIQDDGYQWVTSPNQYDTMDVYLYNHLTDTYDRNRQFVFNSESTHAKQLSKITTQWESINFANNGIVLPKGDYDLKYPIVTGLYVVDNHTTEAHTSYQFQYAPLKEGKDPTLYSHLFLKSLEMQGFEQTYSHYQFQYEGVNLATNGWESMGDYYEEDVFGYHAINSGSEDYRKLYIYPNEIGSNRYRTEPIVAYTGTMIETAGFTSQTVNPRMLRIGMLKSVVLPSGGSEHISYEPNRYFDALSNEDTYGGGVRVSKLRVHDGVSYDNDLEVVYAYVDEQGHSTGKLLYKPTYYQRLPYHQSPTDGNVIHYDSLVNLGYSNSSIWKRTLMFTNQELTESYHPGYTVGYSLVTMDREGIGSSETQYDIPSDLSNAHSSFARALRTSINTPGATDPNCFSGLDEYDAPNINYLQNLRFTGLPTTSVQKDAAGQLVSQQDFIYGTIGVASTVSGLINMPVTIGTDANHHIVGSILNGFLYHPYEVGFGINKVRIGTTSKTYDPSGSGDFISEESNITFDQEGKVMSSTRTDRDGQEYMTRTAYADGYIITEPLAQQSPAVQAISRLQELNQDVPIETISSLMINNVEHVTGARLTIWEVDANTNIPYPKRSYVFRTGNPIPISSFTEATIDGGGTSFSFFDSAYEKVSTIETRTPTGQVISQTGFGQQKGAISYAFAGRRANLQVSGATRDEMVFEDFESDPSEVPGRIGGFGHNLAPGVPLARSLKNDATQDYTFSCWLKSGAAGQLTIEAHGDNGASTTASVNISANSAEWVYYETTLSMAAKTNYAPSFELTSNVAITIDEVAFYPSSATISYVHFGTNYRPIATTDTYGSTSSTTYDFAGRVETIKDGDENIIKAYEYSLSSDFPPTIKIPLYVEENEAADFSVEWATTCTDFKWKFATKIDYLADPIAFDTGLTNAVLGSSTKTQTFATTGLWVVAVGMDCGNGWEPLGEIQTFPVYGETTGPFTRVSLCIDRPTTIDWCDGGPLPYTGGCGTSEIANDVQMQVTGLQGSGSYSYEWREATWSDTNGYYQYQFESIILVSGTSQQYNQSYLNRGVDVYQNKAIRCIITDLNTSQQYYTNWSRFLGYYSDPHCPQQ
ncbi:MAG: hypothetical protein RIM99_15820 [Cyclobacteriaceae bacterium]